MGRNKIGNYMVEKFPIGDSDSQAMEEIVNKKSLPGITTVKDFIRLAIRREIEEIKNQESPSMAGLSGQSESSCSAQNLCAPKGASSHGLKAHQ